LIANRRGKEKVYLSATVANSLPEYSYGYGYEDGDVDGDDFSCICMDGYGDEDKDREGVFVLRERELRAYQHVNSMKNT
jgi:hypothetical protein